MSLPAFHDAVRALLRGQAPPANLDHAAFGRFATTHRLAPYLTDCTPVGPELKATLAPGRLGAEAVWMFKESPIREVLSALRAAGVEPILWKGLGVALTAYPSPPVRPLGDLDLILQPKELAAALTALRGVGCRERSEDPAVVAYYTDDNYQYPMIHPQLGLIELHHHLWPELPEAFLDDLRTSVTKREVAGFTFLAPDDPHMFVTLAVHFGISGPGLIWGWLLDLVLLGRSLDTNGWNTIARITATYGLELYMALVFRLCDELWGERFAGAEVLATACKARLRGPERFMFARVPRLRSGGVLHGDHLRLARMLARRPMRKSRSLLRPLIAHPGVVSLEMGAPSTVPGFTLRRVQHVLRRVRRVLVR